MRKFFIQYNSRINKLSFTLVVFSIILLTSFFKVQILSKDGIKDVVQKKAWKSKTVYGKRGRILDVNGEQLALSIRKETLPLP